MKTTKYIFVLPLIILLNCTSENEKNTSIDKNEQKKVSFVNRAASDYKGQLQYLDGNYDTFEFSYAHNFKVAIPNGSYEWRYFDELYRENLNTGEKQYLAYIILAKKDLISDFKQSPSQEKYDAILKYTTLLVNSNYIGYCLLYHCLEALKNSSFAVNSNNVVDLKESILLYAKDDHYLQDAKTHLISTDPKAAMYLQKITENYDYLPLIKEMVIN